MLDYIRIACAVPAMKVGDVNILKLFKSWKIYYVSVLKLVIFPNNCSINKPALDTLNAQLPKHLTAILPKSLSLMINELTIPHFKLSNKVKDTK